MDGESGCGLHWGVPLLLLRASQLPTACFTGAMWFPQVSGAGLGSAYVYFGDKSKPWGASPPQLLN